jgi:hypothetical protein
MFMLMRSYLQGLHACHQYLFDFQVCIRVLLLAKRPVQSVHQALRDRVPKREDVTLSAEVLGLLKYMRLDDEEPGDGIRELGQLLQRERGGEDEIRLRLPICLVRLAQLVEGVKGSINVYALVQWPEVDL